jgi:hypothetical protein
MKHLFPQEEKANGKRTTALIASFCFAAGNKRFASRTAVTIETKSTS